MGRFRMLQGQAIDGGGVVQTNLNLNSKTLTNCGDISAANASGFFLENAAASSINPTLVPDRGNPTVGVGGASGNLYFIRSSTINQLLSGATSQWTGYDLSISGADADRGGATLDLKVNAMGATLSAAGTHTFAAAIPAGATVVGVTTRVTVTITGCTSIQIGDGTDADRFGNAIALTAGTTTTNADWTITSTPIYAAATGIVITAVGGGASFTAGAMRVCVYYIAPTAPTG